MTTSSACEVPSFGRWGSSDPWLGVPVSWDQISGARVIVEADLPQRAAEMSQGSHFFHDLSSFRALYLSAPLRGASRVDWVALHSLPRVGETARVYHARAKEPLLAKVDGRSRRGVVLQGSGSGP